MDEKPLGTVTLTVEFEIHATSVRAAEKWLDFALVSVEYDDQLKQYEVVKTSWEGPDTYGPERTHRWINSLNDAIREES